MQYINETDTNSFMASLKKDEHVADERDFAIVSFARQYSASRAVLMRYPFFKRKFSTTWSVPEGCRPIAQGMLVVQERYVTAASFYHVIEYLHNDLYFELNEDVLDDFNVTLQVIATADMLGLADLCQTCVCHLYGLLTPKLVMDAILFVQEAGSRKAVANVKAYTTYFLLQALFRLPDEVLADLPLPIIIETIVSDDCAIPSEYDRYTLLRDLAVAHLCPDDPTVAGLRAYLTDASDDDNDVRGAVSRAFMGLALDHMEPTELDAIAEDAIINGADIDAAFRAKAIIATGGAIEGGAPMRRTFLFDKLDLLTPGQQEALPPVAFAGSLFQPAVTFTRAGQLGLTLTRVDPASSPTPTHLTHAAAHRVDADISIPGGIHGFWRLKASQPFTFGASDGSVGLSGEPAPAIGKVVVDRKLLEGWLFNGSLVVNVTLRHRGYSM